jgi:hypothetical protein
MVRAAALSLSALPYLWTSLKRIEVEHLGQAVEILVRAATAGAVTTSWVRELVREDEVSNLSVIHDYPGKRRG